jgi:hypothetical protein
MVFHLINQRSDGKLKKYLPTKKDNGKNNSRLQNDAINLISLFDVHSIVCHITYES